MKRILVITALVLLGAGCYGLSLVSWGGLWRSLNHAMSCPQGQQLTVLYYQPVYNAATKGIDMTPVYGCEKAP